VQLGAIGGLLDADHAFPFLGKSNQKPTSRGEEGKIYKDRLKIRIGIEVLRFYMEMCPGFCLGRALWRGLLALGVAVGLLPQLAMLRMLASSFSLL
jgi:hypothetical protein